MEASGNDIGRWTSDELLTEVLKRGAADRPELQRLQTAVIRALLAEGDRKSLLRATEPGTRLRRRVSSTR